MTIDPGPGLTLPVSARDHIRGSWEAPNTLVQYGDFECPFCGLAYPEIKEVQRRLGDRLRFVFRHFPRTNEHQHAHLAAEAAEAAGAQERFWEMHDLLFENQSALELADLVRYGSRIHLDIDRFKQDVETHIFHERVREDVSSGIHSAVIGTPTFFINGVRHEGRWESAELLTAIEASERARLSDGLAPPSDVAADKVDEASWESFPASDSPAW